MGEHKCWKCCDTGEYVVVQPPYDYDMCLCKCSAGESLNKEKNLKVDDIFFTGVPVKIERCSPYDITNVGF